LLVETDGFVVALAALEADDVWLGLLAGVALECDAGAPPELAAAFSLPDAALLALEIATA
jgi:hypothetical protein